MNPINKDMIHTLMASMPTPAQADQMGIYDDVVEGGDVFSYKGEYLGTKQDRADSLWLREMQDKMMSGEISEREFDRLCEERG